MADKYLVTISYQSKEQPLMREYVTDTVTIEDIKTLAGWEIVENIKQQIDRRFFSDKNVAVNFMMKL